jgi:hypothetical protein
MSTSGKSPYGDKWYFDLSRGEFATMVKLKGNKKKLEKEYPKQRRFTKDQLGRYHTAWGETPYLVKLGGVKVFRYFIDSISGDGDKRKPKEINREFFMASISKVILFRELETIHGTGKNAIGQLRSSVIPYTISALYNITNGNKKNLDFNLNMLWKNQGFDSSLKAYFYDLMFLMNDLIKEYAQSDDFAQYAKKEQLWMDIKKSPKLLEFFNNGDTEKIIRKYGIAKMPRVAKKKSKEDYNFELITKAVELVSLGGKYYKSLISDLSFSLAPIEEKKVSRILQLFKSKKNLSKEDIFFLDELLIEINKKSPSSFENIENTRNNLWILTLNNIIKRFNKCLANDLSIVDEFDQITQAAAVKKVKYGSIYGVIGKKLSNGEELGLVEIYQASYYYKE